MQIKRILVLAKSVKSSGRCVAGREVVGDYPNINFGDWVRPVTGGDGTLRSKHYRLDDGSYTQVLQIVDVPVLKHVLGDGQPENWLLDESKQWSKHGELPASDVRQLEESPGDLWQDRGASSDKIRPEIQTQRVPVTSLTLIAPQQLCIASWKEFNLFKGYNVKKNQATFVYNGQQYRLTITDPEFTAKLVYQESRVSRIDLSDSNTLLCVSLTQPFNGYHYKVVATVLEDV